MQYSYLLVILNIIPNTISIDIPEIEYNKAQASIENKVKEIITEYKDTKNFGNARYIHNLFQKIIIEHAKNNEDSQDESNLYEISLIDINKEKLLSNNDVYHHKIGFV